MIPRRSDGGFLGPIILIACMTAFFGCSPPPLGPREPFEYQHAWKLDSDEVEKAGGVAAVDAKLVPEPLYSDRPGMLEVAVDTGDPEKPFTGKLWYRFAFRRGDPLPEHKHLPIPPKPIPQEEGVAPRYDDWFEWAEIIEPRFERGRTIFTTPVMLSEGKVYIQFRIAPPSEAMSHELLDWFIYVDQPR